VKEDNKCKGENKNKMTKYSELTEPKHSYQQPTNLDTPTIYFCLLCTNKYIKKIYIDSL
jgi:hypothetical protein